MPFPALPPCERSCLPCSLPIMAGTSQLLQLLGGTPTQAAVGALLAGAGAQVALAYANPARCIVYRQPYDDDVFQV